MSKVNELAQSYWLRLCTKIGFSQTRSDATWDTLQTLYCAPERHYHTLTHILQMLHWLDRYDHNYLAELRLAAFFHDAIYDTTSDTNEERSAELAVQFLLTEPCGNGFSDTTNKLILCTKKHKPDNSVENLSGLFLDCDLLILAAAPTDYDFYSTQIRKEYCQFDDAQYRSGRERVMRSFVSREHIFFTPEIRTQYEQRARTNITRELDALSPSSH